MFPQEQKGRKESLLLPILAKNLKKRFFGNFKKCTISTKNDLLKLGALFQDYTLKTASSNYA